jgi:hypothetical protein
MSHAQAYEDSTLIYYQSRRSRSQGLWEQCRAICWCRCVGDRVGGDAAACGHRDERVVDMATLSAPSPPHTVDRSISSTPCSRRRTGPAASLVYVVFSLSLSLDRVRFFSVPCAVRAGALPPATFRPLLPRAFVALLSPFRQSTT